MKDVPHCVSGRVRAGAGMSAPRAALWCSAARGPVNGSMNAPRTMTTSWLSEAWSVECDLPICALTSWGTNPFTMARSPCSMLGVPVSGAALHSFMTSTPFAHFIK